MYRFPALHTRLAVAASMFLVISILALQPAAHAADTSVSILYYESIRLIAAPGTGAGHTTLAAIDSPATLIFEAFGRRFELRADETRAVTGTNYTRLSGRLAGLPGSWFSLLHDGNELRGIIADGVDTYLVEPHRRVAALLIEPPADNAPPSIVFRLADMLVPQGLVACMTPGDAVSTDGFADGQINGRQAFAKLGAELQAATGNALPGNPLLQVGVIADQSFVNSHASETESEIAAIFNTVQGIYANEVGITIELNNVFAVTPDVTNPFPATTDAATLLEELGTWRITNQATLGHTHLLTRNLLINDEGNNIAGISFLGRPGRSGVCQPRTGASLSRDISGLTALIVAHEIGHNLGAPHDGDADGACAATPDMAFIMSPRISRATPVAFSECSIAQINPVITAASCLTETTQTLPASSGDGSGSGGGSALGWLSIVSLLVGVILRRKGNRAVAG